MEITREKFLEMAKWGNFDQMRQLQKEFPEAFKVELEVGKVYKYKHTNKLIKITELKNDDFDGYGFNLESEYDEKITGYAMSSGVWSEANTEHWESKLIEEAKERGYKNGNYECLYMPHLTEDTDGKMFFEDGELWIGFGSKSNMLFKDGVWAEIIKTFSKEEAEKLLGGKII